MPKRVLRTRKDGHVRAEDDDDELLLLDRPNPANKAKSASPTKNGAGTSANSSKKQTTEKMDVDSSTEPESDGEEASKAKEEKRTVQLPSPEPTISNGTFPQSQSQSQSQGQSQSQSQSQSQALDLDVGKQPGHIIGSARPLRDFKQCVKEGDNAKILQAISELGEFIQSVLSQPFARLRHEEMIECMKELRVSCLKVCAFLYAHDLLRTCVLSLFSIQKGEIDNWNAYVLLSNHRIFILSLWYSDS